MKKRTKKKNKRTRTKPRERVRSKPTKPEWTDDQKTTIRLLRKCCYKMCPWMRKDINTYPIKTMLYQLPPYMEVEFQKLLKTKYTFG